ncbi:MAG: hypothetical protein [Circular genetic element sp.]|nr:MAG: hypothetical protein [Circular genetic element sp.]
MAKRYKSRSKKLEPAVTELTFTGTNVPIAGQGPGAVPGTVTVYVDLNQVNSLVNRRFYRQGLVNAVASIKVTTQSVLAGTSTPVIDNPRGAVEVAKLPTTWVMSNAWEKGFRAWQRMNNEALQETESIRPKFLDFKIYADAGHHAAGYGANLLPNSNFLGFLPAATPGEWSPSKISHPLAAGATEGATIEEEIIAVGSSYPGVAPSGFNAVSLIEGYAASRGLPNIADPNTPDDASDTDNATPENWLGAMFNDGTEQTADVLADMITENTIAPYPFENDGVNLDTMYPGGANQLGGLQIHDFELITGSTIGGTTYLRGGSFPCGLLKFTFKNFDETYEILPYIQINLMPGHHRGLLCAPMTEM